MLHDELASLYSVRCSLRAVIKGVAHRIPVHSQVKTNANEYISLSYRSNTLARMHCGSGSIFFHRAYSSAFRGVPEGSVLWVPSSSWFMINDILVQWISHSSAYLSADDIKFFVIWSYISWLFLDDINSLLHWCSVWNLSLNVKNAHVYTYLSLWSTNTNINYEMND